MTADRNFHFRRLFSRKEILTIPNLLSMFRLVLIPVFLWLYVGREDYIGALVVLALSAVSDVLDGQIARRFHMVSDFGKILDPVADKLSQAALMFSLAVRHRAVRFLIVLFAVKELCMAVWGCIVLHRDNAVNSARWYGKLNTVVLNGVMIVLILLPQLPEEVVNILVGLCGAVMLMALLLYGRFYAGILKKKHSP